MSPTSPTEEGSSVKDVQLEKPDEQPKMIPLEIADASVDSCSAQIQYRLYKKRFVGATALVGSCICDIERFFFVAVSTNPSSPVSPQLHRGHELAVVQRHFS